MKVSTGEIPYEVLLRLHNNYQPTQDYLSIWKGITDTQSIWFEMNDDLKKFLEELLKPSREVSGLRVYLCEYRQDSVPPGSNPASYVRKLTVCMIGTKLVGSTHVDHPDEVKEKTNLALDGYNHGKICPPERCPYE
jgi:hypothetical protein